MRQEGRSLSLPRRDPRRSQTTGRRPLRSRGDRSLTLTRERLRVVHTDLTECQAGTQGHHRHAIYTRYSILRENAARTKQHVPAVRLTSGNYSPARGLTSPGSPANALVKPGGRSSSASTRRGSSDLTHTCSGVIKCTGQAWTPTRHIPLGECRLGLHKHK